MVAIGYKHNSPNSACMRITQSTHHGCYSKYSRQYEKYNDNVRSTKYVFYDHLHTPDQSIRKMCNTPLQKAEEQLLTSMAHILRIEVQSVIVQGQQVHEHHHIYTTIISTAVGNVQFMRRSQLLALTATVVT